MSIYNAIFGVNSLAGMVMAALNTSHEAVPRFRDAYFDAENFHLVIHTRTGGGNREFYESVEACRRNYPEYFGEGRTEPSGPWNSDLRKLPGFLFDLDDDFDCTYADWHYAVPEAWCPLFEQIKAIGAGSEPPPAERWQALFRDLKKGAQTEEAKKATEIGRDIVNHLTWEA